LDGVSVSQPTSEQAFAVGAALAQLHNALEDFTETRPNPLGLKSWRPLFGKCAAQDTASVKPDLSGEIADELEFLEAHWPTHLPQSAIHADLFPDNVLMLNGQVTGLIDFYFACTDVRAYDVAVTHAAWSFNGDGSVFQPEISAAILNGYKTARQFSHDEYQALPILARGACMRFLLTRLFDWINTPAGALVTRKDPLAFLRRLHYYRAVGHSLWT
jgi:homoserine kinase type II